MKSRRWTVGRIKHFYPELGLVAEIMGVLVAILVIGIEL